MTRRTLWTSGFSDLDAVNNVGQTRPWCGTAADAQRYSAEGEHLYRITIEEFRTDHNTLVASYLQLIDPEPEEAADTTTGD